MRQIQSNSDKITKKNVLNRVSDVQGGVSLNLSNLVAGQIVEEGTPLTAPTAGKRTVCKQAKLLTGSTTTVLVVDSASHNFAVGDIVMQQVGGVGATITDVTDNGDGTASITVDTALESATAGVFIYESSAAGATAGALANTADVILKDGFEVPANQQVIYIRDAYVRADVHADVIGPLYLADIPGVIEIKY